MYKCIHIYTHMSIHTHLLLFFSCPVVLNSLWLHGLQHTRPPCSSPSPEICPSSCPLHSWCHTAISSSDVFFFCLQSFPASGTFPMSWLFTSDDRKYWSFSFSASPSNEYSGLISLKVVWFDHLAVQGTFRILLQYHIFFFPVPHFEGINTHIYIY